MCHRDVLELSALGCDHHAPVHVTVHITVHVMLQSELNYGWDAFDKAV